VKRILEPTFGKILCELSNTFTNKEKVEENFEVFQTFAKNIPEKVLEYMYHRYKEERCEDSTIPDLTKSEITKLLSWYFDDKNRKAHKSRVGDLVSLPEVEEYPRILTDTLQEFHTQLAKLVPSFKLSGQKRKRYT
jgi:hypothetical protein